MRAFTVLEVNRYIQSLFQNDALLDKIAIKGEIGNFKFHKESGHLYFSLLDETSSINCVMFAQYAKNLSFMPQNGMAVTITGTVSVYIKGGIYHLICERVTVNGDGFLQQSFEAMKNSLDKKGYFDRAVKKRIPLYPETVAVITSETGAAVKDIIKIGRRRNPCVQMVLYPALVQGLHAVQSLCEAIYLANQHEKADCIILGRGGGAYEDLQAFNSEEVATAVYESKIPVVSAVGHESDFTITDLVADMRASTPSAAAELIIPERKQIKAQILGQQQKMAGLMQTLLTRYALKISTVSNHISLRRPSVRIETQMDYLNAQGDAMQLRMQFIINRYELKVQMLMDKMDAVSPMHLLRRGYNLLYSEADGRLIKSVADVLENECVQIRLSDGKIKAVVIDAKREAL